MQLRHPVLVSAALSVAGVVGIAALTLATLAARTETEITGFRAAVARAGTAARSRG